VLAHGALTSPHFEFRGDFVAQIHGAFYPGDEANVYYPALPRLEPPTFCLLGAPLVLTET
jgi:hypothetical protein